MVAAMTPLPVIGVPVRGSSLDGLDSLLSIVQVFISLINRTVDNSSRYYQNLGTLIHLFTLTMHLSILTHMSNYTYHNVRL